MAVNWLWKNKMGEYVRHTAQGDITITLYKGNCLGVEIYNIPDSNQYQFSGFWNDKDHLRRCLGVGIDACDHNLYADVKSLRLNKYFASEASKIAKSFVDANSKDPNWNLQIDFYYEVPEDDKEV